MTLQSANSRVLALGTLAMLAFAANSILCRLALVRTPIDPASFTTIRIVAGALVLWAIAATRGPRALAEGSWPSAAALFAYAAGFSFAYVTLPAAAGALLLFGSVQATMIGYGAWRGERLRARQVLGLAAACLGLIGLLLPRVSAPSPRGAILMIAAGIAWGVYSLRGRGIAKPIEATAGNFVRATPFAIVLSLLWLKRLHIDPTGAAYAVASGAITSGIGYSIWYTALRGISATIAAVMQLTVPAIAAFGGVLLLGETFTLRLLIASVVILGGVAVVIFDRKEVNT
jgi:drug/metabolite transporter (DMT)-like permease